MATETTSSTRTTDAEDADRVAEEPEISPDVATESATRKGIGERKISEPEPPGQPGADVITPT